MRVSSWIQQAKVALVSDSQLKVNLSHMYSYYNDDVAHITQLYAILLSSKFAIKITNVIKPSNDTELASLDTTVLSDIATNTVKANYNDTYDTSVFFEKIVIKSYIDRQPNNHNPTSRK